MNRFIIIALMFLFACNMGENKNTTTSTDSANINEPAAVKINTDSLQGCYQMTFNRDTAHLTLVTNDSSVTGHLTIRLFEKDMNDGTLTGNIEQDLLKAQYVFKSEGRVSIREVVFRISNGRLYEGFGEIQQRGDTVLFRNTTNLRYDTTRPYVKVPCTT